MQINTKQISRCPAGSCAVIGKGECPDLDFFQKQGFGFLPAMCVFIQTSSCCPAAAWGSPGGSLACLRGVVLNSQVGEQFIQRPVSPQAQWAAAQL